MGIFNNYLKPGPGVPENEPQKSRPFLFFVLLKRKFFKFVQLNLLFFVCMIPAILGLYLSIRINPNLLSDSNSSAASGYQPIIAFTGDIVGLIFFVISLFVTGPAIAGFTFVIRNFQREEHAWVLSDFFENFRKNYLYSVIIDFIDAAVFIIFYIAHSFYSYQLYSQAQTHGTLMMILTIQTIILPILYMWMHYYIYVMLVTFKINLRGLFKNSLIFALMKLPLNIFITLICGIIIVLNLIFPGIGMLLSIFISLSLIGYIIIFCVYPTIDKVMIHTAEDNKDE